MRRLPTDLQILNAIYNRYYDFFAAYDEEANKNRGAKVYVPIDIEAIARDLGVDLDIVFGRLYYHLQNKYGYSTGEGTSRVNTPFFSLRSAGDRHCVNFPYLASVLADMRDEHRKYRLATGMSAVSLVISVTTFVLTRVL